MATTTDSTGAIVAALDYVAYATTEGRGITQKIYRISYVYGSGVCDAFDPVSGRSVQIGCLSSQGVKLTNYVPK